jgi:hypothetical protein
MKLVALALVIVAALAALRWRLIAQPTGIMPPEPDVAQLDSTYHERNERRRESGPAPYFTPDEANRHSRERLHVLRSEGLL